jgi:hypothetical protein
MPCLPSATLLVVTTQKKNSSTQLEEFVREMPGMEALWRAMTSLDLTSLVRLAC